MLGGLLETPIGEVAMGRPPRADVPENGTRHLYSFPKANHIMSTFATNTLKAVFMAFGQSPAIGQLPNRLSGSIEECIVPGDCLSRDGKLADQFSVSVALFDRPESNEVVLRQVEKWLTEHSQVLIDLDARKIMEFQSYLDSQTGSRTVTVPNTIIRLCSNAGLDLAHQAIRVLTESEYARLRGQRQS